MEIPNSKQIIINRTMGIWKTNSNLVGLHSILDKGSRMKTIIYKHLIMEWEMSEEDKEAINSLTVTSIITK